MRSKQSGFTIVELLIVIIVIGILSALSIVAYTTLQTRSRTAVITNSLSQAKTKLEVYKVEQGTYPTTGNFSAAGIPSSPNATYSYVSMDGSAYCLTATNSTITYGITNTTTPTEGGCGNTNWLGNVTLTNMVMNGDFNDGATGWTLTNSNRATIEVVDGYGQFTGTGMASNYEITFPNVSSSIAGHVYYYRSDIRVANGVPAQLMVYYGTSSVISGAVVQSVWMAKSTRWTAPTSTATRYLRVEWGTSEAQLGKITHLDNVVLIDLTTAFGAGNEPTKEQMDTMLSQFPNSYFNGTVSAGG